MNYQLKNISEKDHGTVYELQTGKNLLGRSRSATIRILLDDISGKQCILHSNGLQVKLENLSRFGTRVNNSKVIESVDLVEGDIITLGAKCQLLLEKCPEEPQAVEREMLLVGEKDPLHDTVVDLLPGEQPDIPVAAFFPGHTGADEGIKKEPLQENAKTLTGTVGEEATAATRFVEDLLQKETPLMLPGKRRQLRPASQRICFRKRLSLMLPGKRRQLRPASQEICLWKRWSALTKQKS